MNRGRLDGSTSRRVAPRDVRAADRRPRAGRNQERRAASPDREVRVLAARACLPADCVGFDAACHESFSSAVAGAHGPQRAGNFVRRPDVGDSAAVRRPDREVCVQAFGQTPWAAAAVRSCDEDVAVRVQVVRHSPAVKDNAACSGGPVRLRIALAASHQIGYELVAAGRVGRGGDANVPGYAVTEGKRESPRRAPGWVGNCR
jgi:hypothetical protein